MLQTLCPFEFQFLEFVSCFGFRTDPGPFASGVAPPESIAGFQPASRRDGGHRLLCGHFLGRAHRRVPLQMTHGSSSLPMGGRRPGQVKFQVSTYKVRLMVQEARNPRNRNPKQIQNPKFEFLQPLSVFLGEDLKTFFSVSSFRISVSEFASCLGFRVSNLAPKPYSHPGPRRSQPDPRDFHHGLLGTFQEPLARLPFFWL